MAEGADQEPVLSGKNISFLELATERAAEIQQLTDAIENPNRTNMAYQRLPRHMQRRAMSHDPKRLPVRLREIFKAQRDMTQLRPSKRPSRRHRRRPSQLLQEYNRRQRHHVWLETHIWHARRFHMVKRWGYTLPESAVDKGFRAAYRATAHHCLVQDVSYLCHLELCGPESSLVSGLSTLGASSAASSCLLSGRRWGRTLLHHPSPPHAALAPAGLLWAPQGSSGGEDRRLWLWVHPAGYAAVLEALLRVFGLPAEPAPESVQGGNAAAEVMAEQGQDVEMSGDGEAGVELDRTSDVAMEAECAEAGSGNGDVIAAAGDADAAGPADTQTDTANTTEAAPETAVEAADTALPSQPTSTPAPSRKPAKNVDQLKLAPRRLHQILRHSSAGVTLTILRDRLVRLRLTGPAAQATLQACLRVPAEQPPWPAAGSGLSLQQQQQLWESLGKATSPAELPPRCVLGLTVDDPRLHTPRQRQMARQAPDELSDEPILELPGGAEASSLWDESTRHQVTTTKVSDNQLNLMRSQLLVPSATPEAMKLPPLPVLLLQDSHPAGWDVVLPVGWAMTFWVSLQYHGARAGGLRETDRLALETGTLRFPAEFPDSVAGQQWDAQHRDAARDDYFKHPPAKRTNYAKLGVPDPFVSPWRRLCELPADSPLGVCRDRSLLRRLCSALSAANPPPEDWPPETLHLLVAVRLRAEGRGVPCPGALLCLPSAADLTSSTAPVEPAAADTVEKKRTEQRAAWLRRQKTEKRRRQRSRRRQQPGKATELAAAMEAERARQRESMQRLHLPGEGVLPIRQEVGRVSSGDFCLSEAVGVGTGFVVLKSLLQLVQMGSRGRLLFRNTNATAYRWCRLAVLEDHC